MARRGVIGGPFLLDPGTSGVEDISKRLSRPRHGEQRGPRNQMRMIVDGRRVEVSPGATVLDAVNTLEIPLPQLCKDPDRPALGACRTCLVHVEGQRGTPAACHLCGRCTPACDDVQQIGAISMLGRGHAMKVGVVGDALMSASVCTSCGQCVATCPTGALRPKEEAAMITRRVDTTCPYCGVGCGITVAVREDRRLAVMADDAPANLSSLGMLCVKGRFGTGFVHARDRIVEPMVKRDGRWEHVSWDEALDAAADGLARHHGRFGALASAKATNEDGYLIQKLCRVVMGTNNVDHCTRLCHSPSVEAMLISMGSGATSNSYVDYEEAGCLMIVGSDASANHPVIAVRFRRAMSRGAKIIVINPKRIELCEQADLWIQQRPGTDVALFNAMAKVILDEGLANREFIRTRTEGFEDWEASLAPFTLDHAAALTGVPAEVIAQAARWYARPPFAGSCPVWGLGVPQHINGIDNAPALLNLSLAAGQLGFPGAGISPLRGQNKDRKSTRL